MLDDIEREASAITSFNGQWDMAEIPGPGGNWGGSFYTIPKQGHAYEQEEAYDFIEWLIQPEQQLKIMAETGRLPAQTAILESDAVASLTNEFFNDAPYGEISAKSALDLPAPTYCAPNSDAIRAAMEQILNDAQAGNCSPWDVWENAIEAATRADIEGGVPSCGRPPGTPPGQGL
ncbi:MAG: extracellular solute-binding protein [Demequinaceae bacterium]|nr:extracellular solute-binding protein [Demequinaceae bacterium]